MHDRLSSTPVRTTVNKYNLKVYNQNHKKKVDSKNKQKVKLNRIKMYRLTAYFLKGLPIPTFHSYQELA